MDKLIKFIQELGWDENEAIKNLKQYLNWQESKKKAQQKYYQKNKNKLDQKHAKYRRTHPGFRKKAIIRTQKSRRKV